MPEFTTPSEAVAKLFDPKERIFAKWQKQGADHQVLEFKVTGEPLVAGVDNQALGEALREFVSSPPKYFAPKNPHDHTIPYVVRELPDTQEFRVEVSKEYMKHLQDSAKAAVETGRS